MVHLSSAWYMYIISKSPGANSIASMVRKISDFKEPDGVRKYNNEFYHVRTRNRSRVLYHVGVLWICRRYMIKYVYLRSSDSPGIFRTRIQKYTTYYIYDKVSERKSMWYQDRNKLLLLYQCNRYVAYKPTWFSGYLCCFSILFVLKTTKYSAPNLVRNCRCVTTWIPDFCLVYLELCIHLLFIAVNHERDTSFLGMQKYNAVSESSMNHIFRNSACSDYRNLTKIILHICIDSWEHCMIHWNVKC